MIAPLAVRSILPTVAPPIVAADPVFQLTRALVEYLTGRDEQQTRRTEIEAHRDVHIAAIEADREVLEAGIAAVFAERGEALAHLGAALRQATEVGDAELARALLDALLAVLARDPFADLAAFRRRVSEDQPANR